MTGILLTLLWNIAKATIPFIVYICMLGEKDEEIGKEIDFQMYPNDKVSDALPLQNDFRNVTVYFRVGDPSNFWVVFVFLQKSSPPKKRINPWIAGFFLRILDCGFWQYF